MSAYAPTGDSKDKDKDLFYDTLAKTVEEEDGSLMYIGGDFNAATYKRQTHEKQNIREHIIERTCYLSEGITDNTRDNRN